MFIVRRQSSFSQHASRIQKSPCHVDELESSPSICVDIFERILQVMYLAQDFSFPHCICKLCIYSKHLQVGLNWQLEKIDEAASRLLCEHGDSILTLRFRKYIPSPAQTNCRVVGSPAVSS